MEDIQTLEIKIGHAYTCTRSFAQDKSTYTLSSRLMIKLVDLYMQHSRLVLQQRVRTQVSRLIHQYNRLMCRFVDLYIRVVD